MSTRREVGRSSRLRQIIQQLRSLTRSGAGSGLLRSARFKECGDDVLLERRVSRPALLLKGPEDQVCLKSQAIPRRRSASQSIKWAVGIQPGRPVHQQEYDSPPP